MKKPNVSPSHQDLYGLVADMVDLLLRYGCPEDEIVWTLKQYGITKSQAKDWYGIPYEN